MEKIFEGDVKPDFDELCEYERISNKQSYGGSYFSFYALGCVVLAGAIIDILLPSTTNWFFVAAAVLAGLFFLFQPLHLLFRNQTSLIALSAQTQIRIVLAEQQTIFRAARHHSVRLVCAFCNQIVYQSADICL